MLKKMSVEEVTERSKERAERIVKEQGGFIVPVYAVVKTDEEDNIVRITHDSLHDVIYLKE